MAHPREVIPSLCDSAYLVHDVGAAQGLMIGVNTANASESTQRVGNVRATSSKKVYFFGLEIEILIFV